jgi:flagellar hook-associated protein 3 FlgL
MIFPSLGDGALSFQLSRQNNDLKTGLNRLSGELSSGEVSDRTRALGGDTSRFSGISHSLKILDTFRQATRETAQNLSAVQTTLSAFDGKRASLAADFLTVSESSPSYQVDEVSRKATTAFRDLVGTLNTRVADRTLLGGAAVDQTALASPDAMLADIAASVGPTTILNDIVAAVDTWFDDPAGGFATMGYTGDSGDRPSRALNETANVTLDARADDPAIRDVLKAAALASLADSMVNLAPQSKGALVFESGVRMQTAATGVAQLQSRVGFAEQEVERTSVENSARHAVLSAQYNDNIGADPFDTASALQSLQIQLETHYAMTARLSRLSLVEYLR